MTEDTALRLRERMIQGELPREQLQLADALGYAPAQAALQRPDAPPPGPWDPAEGEPTLEYWGRRLGRFGPNAMMRIATALARCVAQRQGEGHPALSAGLEVADAFLERTGGGGLAETCEAAAKEVARAALRLESTAPKQAQACLTLLPLLRAVLAILEGGPTDRALLDDHYLRTLEQATLADLPLEEVQAAICAEVCAWALATPD